MCAFLPLNLNLAFLPFREWALVERVQRATGVGVSQALCEVHKEADRLSWFTPLDKQKYRYGGGRTFYTLELCVGFPTPDLKFVFLLIQRLLNPSV
jgi:hypothetical protein